MDEWIRCIDKMPDTGVRVLTCSKSGKVEIRTLKEDAIHIDRSFSDLFGGVFDGVIHDVTDLSFDDGTGRVNSGKSAVNSPIFWECRNWNDDPVVAWMPLPKPL